MRLNKLLNKYTTIKKIHLNQLKNKTFAIDLSIFFYKFIRSKNNCINIEKNYLLDFEKQINKLHKYKIIPIYIFDGKPNPEKQITLKYRKEVRLSIKEKLQKNPYKSELKKKLIIFNHTYKNELIHLFNDKQIKYILAKGEADDECIDLFKNKQIDGVFTEDNDILLGKATVYKNLNNYNDYVYEYNINNILKQLNMSYKDFISICILAGTSYSKKWCDIFDAYALYLYNQLPKIPYTRIPDMYKIIYNI